MGITENLALNTFKKVTELGSIHSAARELRLTQTAVTKRIQSLEKSLLLTLFLRSRRGMTLTPDGEALLQHCRSLEELEGIFLSRISGRQRADIELTVVGPTSAISTRVIDDCHVLYDSYPHLRLHFRSEDHSNLVDLLRKGEADLAIVPPGSVPNEMDSKILRPDRYLLVASPRWKTKTLKEIVESERMIDFYDSDEMTRKYLKKFNLELPKKTKRIYVNDNDALIRLISLGVGYGTLTESVARPYLESHELIALNRAQAMEDPLALVWYPRTQKADYFLDLVKSVK